MSFRLVIPGRLLSSSARFRFAQPPLILGELSAKRKNFLSRL
jgi:hypothetical protein